ncbi:hypothetical protein M758_9G067900 [Ceratodon purpureus]|nr:hypothetical protein M758_9G067900 [Ceratodon purpureus]
MKSASLQLRYSTSILQDLEYVWYALALLSLHLRMIALALVISAFYVTL